MTGISTAREHHMLNDLSSDESKRRAAIDLLKNADEGRDEALKKYTHLVCQLHKNANEFCVNP
jgi:hypothetical protein